MSYSPPLLKQFNRPWRECAIAVLDVETTGLRPGIDRVVEVGLARFECGNFVESVGSFVNPGMPIPEEATAIHGITDEMVADAPSLDDVLLNPAWPGLARNAQPAAYNATFDRVFIPPWFSTMDWYWLDLIPIVRHVDRYERGKGQHKLAAACARHGVELGNAHRAVDDARAAGELFYKLADELYKRRGKAVETLGDLLLWTRQAQAQEWFRFNHWVAREEEIRAAVRDTNPKSEF